MRTDVEDSHRMVANYIRKHNQETWQIIANKLGISYSTVSHIAKEYGLSRRSRNRISVSPALMAYKEMV
jgi:DNA-binding MurR/RpiR family transcriptional regulator